MKNILFVLLMTCFAFGQSTEITILHTGDSHSHLDAFGPKDAYNNGTIGGIGKAGYLIATEMAVQPDALFFHSGDFSVGDLFFNMYLGIPELQILNQLGCDALTVGNHELDLGPSTLDYVFDEAFEYSSFPVLSANLDLTGYPSLGDYISPYTIKTVSGVKVGVFGLTIPEPLSNAYPVVIQDNIPEIAYATVNAMQSAGAQVIILLSHLGSAYDYALGTGVPGIHFIIGGHDHYVFEQPLSVPNPAGFQTLIMQAGTNYEYVGKLKFSYSSGIVNFISYDLLHADASVEQVPEIQSVVSDLKAGIVAAYGDVFNTMVGYSKNGVDKVPTNQNFKDSPLGNLITDAYRYKTNTDIAITAHGLLADKIYAGNINAADIFRTAPYGFSESTGLGFNLVTVDIQGIQLITGLEIGLSQLGITEDYFLYVSGIKFKYNPDNPVGSRVIFQSLKINGQQINPYAMYSLTINEGLYMLLDQNGVEVQNVTMTGIPEFTALNDFVINLGTVNYKSEGRIKDKSFGDNAKEEGNSQIDNTMKYQLFENYPNPFNPSTTIKFQIPKDENVSLKIYNMLGKEVVVLANGYFKSGIYSFKFDAGNLASGVYFYVIKTNSYSDTKKMLLIK